MDLVLCHTTADFDTLGAAVGLARLQPGRRIVLTGGSHPTVQRFLALYRDEYPLIERRAVDPDLIRQLTLVDAQQPDRFGPAAEWIVRAEHNQVPVTVYDHHPASGEALAATAQEQIIEAVGAATTLVVEALQQNGIEPTAAEATVMALGIHVDTGSLLYETATARDAAALAWLMAHGASLGMIADFVEPGLSPPLQTLLTAARAGLQVETLEGHSLAWVLLKVDRYLPGLSGLAERLMSLADADALLFGAYYSGQEKTSQPQEASTPPAQAGDPSIPQSVPQKLTLIGRARGRLGDSLDWGALLTALGGGGHPTAASAAVTTTDPEGLVQQLLEKARSQLPPQPRAVDLMSSPVRTLRPDTTIREAQRILLRYGHSGLSVVDEGDRLVGIISRRDLDLALHHGFSHAPVKGYMATNLKTIAPDTPLATIENLMVTYDIGRLPVLHQGSLVGMVTRTDLLRHLHQGYGSPSARLAQPTLPAATTLQHTLETSLPPLLHSILQQIAAAAQERGWHLYLVGGAVRDLLICSDRAAAALPDIDLVVDGWVGTTGAGVELAAAIKTRFPEIDLQVHGRFQTASLVWRKDLDHPLAGVMIDIATARTEFYPYPAANPEVEASSIQQDLYRRDFTINALALRLTAPGAGQLLDYFGGLMDLRQGVIRVLHANSFIEDPTRIYRAVRFAVRLGFSLDAQTEGYIRHALASGIYAQMQRQVKRAPALQTRLKNELKYILEAPYWQAALALLDQLEALRCLHEDLAMTPTLWQQLRRLSRWGQRYGWPEVGPPWLLRLEGLLAALPPAARSPLAANLQLPDRTLERLAHLDNREHSWQALVTASPTPGILYTAFSQADTATLLLASARHPHALGPAIWQYLMQWAVTPPLVDGNQLKALGYRPGPRFRPMLEAVFAAQLNGDIATPAEAEAFLAQHYPSP
ncbi:CBS domain-containing protein [Nodosilinea nodulosa]|uniref:CBS domain-containing protein n=1 Tax=Nodosilinea nodulosa TaxID=416001 RepID=UPI0002DCBFA1|nr:CBS domain-containing protein [Nodosilinea nodulosa]